MIQRNDTEQFQIFLWYIHHTITFLAWHWDRQTDRQTDRHLPPPQLKPQLRLRSTPVHGYGLLVVIGRGRLFFLHKRNCKTHRASKIGNLLLVCKLWTYMDVSVLTWVWVYSYPSGFASTRKYQSILSTYSRTVPLIQYCVNNCNKWERNPSLTFHAEVLSFERGRTTVPKIWRYIVNCDAI